MEIDQPLPKGYTYLREELRFEHTLLGGRMTYYMTSQSFLFTAAAFRRRRGVRRAAPIGPRRLRPAG
jgi:hypothetical protein